MAEGAGERLGVVEIYRRSLKPHDLRFNNWVCRPVAALFVYLLRPTPVTPNQVTFLSLLVALLGDAALLFCPGRMGLAAAALLLYLSFVFDCTDGQLARIKGQSSTVGAYLDFLMDEIKAVALIAAVALRLSRDLTALPLLPEIPPSDGWLLLGLLGVVVAASGCSVTTFMRRPEYFEATTGKKAERVPGFTALREADATATKPPSGVRQLLLLPVRILEWLGKLALHYPAWFYIPALLGRLEWFLIPYLVAHTLYLGRSGLVILIKLGRPLRSQPTA
jgi:hypothetical protein